MVDKTRKIFCDTVLGRPVRVCSYTAQLEAENEQRPSIKVSDGDVWLVFPNAMISVEGICKFGQPGPIVRSQLRKWRDALLAKALGGE